MVNLNTKNTHLKLVVETDNSMAETEFTAQNLDALVAANDKKVQLPPTPK